MEHNNLIANELKSIGFETMTCQNGVLVWLNRPLSTIEIEIALTQLFDDLSFIVVKSGKNVLVRAE